MDNPKPTLADYKAMDDELFERTMRRTFSLNHLSSQEQFEIDLRIAHIQGRKIQAMLKGGLVH
jgi:hypothetical protein